MAVLEGMMKGAVLGTGRHLAHVMTGWSSDDDDNENNSAQDMIDPRFAISFIVLVERQRPFPPHRRRMMMTDVPQTSSTWHASHLSFNLVIIGVVGWAGICNNQLKIVIVVAILDWCHGRA